MVGCQGLGEEKMNCLMGSLFEASVAAILTTANKIDSKASKKEGLAYVTDAREVSCLTLSKGHTTS